MGGGLAGVVIVVQGWATWIQYKHNGELQDKMLEMAQVMVMHIAREFNEVGYHYVTGLAPVSPDTQAVAV